MLSSIPSAQAYGVYASRLIRHACVAQMSDFFLHHKARVTRLLSQGYKVNRLSNTFKKFYGRYTDLVEQHKKMSAKCLLMLSVEMVFILMDLPMADLIKLAKMAGVMHEAHHVYSIRSTW